MTMKALVAFRVECEFPACELRGPMRETQEEADLAAQAEGFTTVKMTRTDRMRTMSSNVIQDRCRMHKGMRTPKLAIRVGDRS